MVAAWKFPDPRDLGVFTVQDVLSGKRPILSVSHDVADGAWQFLSEKDPDLEQARLVCLADMVELDSTIEELADLPLGWKARRASREQRWVREACFPTAWDELVSEACEFTEECQEALKDEFSLSDWERYDYDQEAASLVFSSGGVARVTMSIQVAGSWSRKSSSWLWAWDNTSILPSASENVHLLRRFGEQHGFERMHTAYFEAEEGDAWELASVACLLLEGDGVYRAPDEHGALFMVVKEPSFIAG
jgi:hypothetical protein